MPRGQRGCFSCGETSTQVIQVWLRRYTEDRDSCGNRRQRSVDSVARTFCDACADAVVVQIEDALRRRWPALHGCATCGQRCERRIQLWNRWVDGTHIASVTGSYCGAHWEDAWRRIAAPLKPDEYKHVDTRTMGDSSLAKARARIAR